MASFDGPHQRRLRRRTLDPFLIVALCCWFGWDGLIRLVTCARQQQVECDVDGTCTSMKENDGDNDDSNQNDSCGLYMAISSIPNAGWGLYAGRDLVANSTTDLEDWKDVMIQLVDTQSHNLALVHELLWNKGRSLMERSNPQLKERRIRALLQQHALLLDNYVWSSVETGAYYDADTVESIAPGLGMLANGHTGLFNLEQQVCDYTQFQTFVSSSNVSDQRRQQRRNPRVGASSYYQDCGVRITRDVPAGHELLAKYGDDWFMDRKDTFGDDVSYTMDYVSVDKLIQVWQQKVQQEEDGDAIYASWEKLLKDYDTVFPPGSRRILPKSAYDALRMDYSPDNTRNNSIAYLEIPDVIRSMEWLKQHGLCVDHIRVVNAAVIPTAQSTPSSQQLPWNAVPLDHERSAVARRFRPAGSLVAPAPLMHLSRDQLAMLLVDVSHSSSEENDTRSGRVVLWRGHQLLLNYCYGHPDSSILLFPYSPGVNLINHYLDNTTSTTTTTDERHPNVALRWSKSMTHPEWLEWNTTTVLEQNSTGLMMEFYAIRDIHEGDELLLDYGPAWQSAWDEHVQEWNRRLEQLDLASSVETAMTVLSNVGTKNDYLSAKEYYRECLDTIDLNSSHVECLAQIPSWTELRCLVRPSVVEAGEAGSKLDGDTVFDWTPLKGNTTMMDQSIPCHVLSKDGDTGTYIVQAELLVHNQTTETLTAPRTTRTIRNVPLTGFFLVDRRYTNNQLLRHAFRHEIALPEAMVPSAWRDLVYYEDDTNICGLYMAESAIPNSGLGMYTARPIQNGDRIFHGDVVVQVEDMELNTKLRHWMDKDFNFDENDWLLHNYYWNPKNSFGNYEAESVQSIIPGLGMLANSHTGLVNADIKGPTRLADLNRGKDPGTGGSTTYHDVHFTAIGNITAGTEIFVEYGDSWFEDREDMGLIPLSDDFRDADASLKKLLKLVNQTTKKLDKEMFHDVLQLLGNISASRPRMANAIPKSIDYDGLRHAVEDGTASLTVPNRVRSLSWLMENGRCLDNIEPSKSTIRQAGRGAFATRTIVKGEVIAPMPMVHVRRRHMNVFGGDDYNDKKASIWLDGQQLILNYCYGHPESSLLLFPYAPVVNYVNHQTLASGGVNADLRWSTLPNHKTEWLQRTPEELDSQSYAGLIMDMIATRDIAAGEEIFLFYGHQWDSSWKRFVYQWTPSNNELGYAATAELNRRWEWIKTKDEMVTSPYRFSNRNDVFTMCFVGSLWRVDDEQPDKEQDRVIQWTGSDDLFDTSSYAYPCDILERHFNISQFSSSEQVYDRIDSVKPVDLSYKVKLQLKRKKSIIVDFVPRKAIQFFDSKYMSDNFLRSAFRHEIHLPDSMVPNAWRDLKETK